MTIVIQNEMEMGAIAIKECLDDGRLEKVIREQRGVALQILRRERLSYYETLQWLLRKIVGRQLNNDAAIALSTQKRLDAAVEELLKLEKEVRSTADLSKVQRVVMAIIQLCSEARAWKTLIRQVLFLSQRPDQPKQAVVAMIELAVSYLNDIPDFDTRNELAEILNSITASEGLQSFYWHFLLTHDNFSGRSEPQIESLNLSGLYFSRDSYEERDQEPTPQQFLTTDFERRPSTPPQQRVKVNHMCPPICREPLKKKAYLMRKPMGPVCRRLFSQTSPADVEEFLSELEQSSQQRFIERYNFDPVEKRPLPGRFEWSPQRPQLPRATSVDSSTEVRRSEMSSTLSA